MRTVWTLIGQLRLTRIFRDLLIYLFICETCRPQSDPWVWSRSAQIAYACFAIFIFCKCRFSGDAALGRQRCFAVVFPPGRPMGKQYTLFAFWVYDPHELWWLAAIIGFVCNCMYDPRVVSSLTCENKELLSLLHQGHTWWSFLCAAQVQRHQSLHVRVTAGTSV